MLRQIKKRIALMVQQFNQISNTASIHPTAYCSGSVLLGQVRLGEKSKIHQCYIDGNVEVGRYSAMWGPGIHVSGRVHGIRIGSFTSIAYDVSIQEDMHNLKRVTTFEVERNLLGREVAGGSMVSKGPVVIGHDVWIGAGVRILSGVTIGHGAVVGAGAVVSKDIPPYAVAVGNPAKVIKYRFDQNTIDQLMSDPWWDWPMDKILQNIDFLTREHP